MRITRLELKNFRTFDSAVFEDIPDTVVLVSPNGCGKSSILEAIVGMHELIAPYHRKHYGFSGPWERTSVPVWPDHFPPPVKLGKRSAEITIEVEATGLEREYLEGANIPNMHGKATFVIEGGRHITRQQVDNTIKKLFQYHAPSEGIGFVDYIRPVRFYLNCEIGSFANEMSDDRTKQIFTEFHRKNSEHQKFSTFKSFVVATQLGDLSHLQSTDERRDSLAIFREVFDRFFAPKRFIGYDAPSAGGEPQVVVECPWGRHDTDSLSDGEKEVLHIMAHLYRFRGLPNIAIWDTPELHLNAALESRLYGALQMIAPDNQYWLATHSLEFIDSVPLDTIHVIQQNGNTATLERASGEDRKTRVAIYQDMGAQVGLQLVSSLVVFVEGKKAHSDKRILDRLVAAKVPGVNFIAGGSCENILSAGTKANHLLEEACTNGDFLAIVDRDYRSDEELDEMVTRYNNRVFVWPVHEIENLFLAPEVVHKTLELNDCLRMVDNVQTTDAIQHALEEAARACREWIAADWAAWELSRSCGPLGRRIGGQDPKACFAKYVSKLQSAVNDIATPEKIEECYIAKLTEVDDLIESGQWRVRLPGKQILAKFLEPYSAVLNLDRFVRVATGIIAENGIELPEVQRLTSVLQETQGATRS